MLIHKILMNLIGSMPSSLFICRVVKKILGAVVFVHQLYCFIPGISSLVTDDI